MPHMRGTKFPKKAILFGSGAVLKGTP